MVEGVLSMVGVNVSLGEKPLIVKVGKDHYYYYYYHYYYRHYILVLLSQPQ